jgi:DNA-binding MarR family transcriptional regulator
MFDIVSSLVWVLHYGAPQHQTPVLAAISPIPASTTRQTLAPRCTVVAVVTATAAWLDETEMGAWQAFLRASIRLMDRLDAELDGHGLSLADYEILVHLSGEASGELRMTELAARTLVSRSGLTRRLDRLVESGLVARRNCPTDRRGVYAVLTDEGRERLERAAPTHVEGVRRHFISRLEGQDLDALTASLNAVVESAVSPDSPASRS